MLSGLQRQRPLRMLNGPQMRPRRQPPRPRRQRRLPGQNSLLLRHSARRQWPRQTCLNARVSLPRRLPSRQQLLPRRPNHPLNPLLPCPSLLFLNDRSLQRQHPLCHNERRPQPPSSPLLSDQRPQRMHRHQQCHRGQLRLLLLLLLLLSHRRHRCPHNPLRPSQLKPLQPLQPQRPRCLLGRQPQLLLPLQRCPHDPLFLQQCLNLHPYLRLHLRLRRPLCPNGQRRQRHRRPPRSPVAMPQPAASWS